MATQNNLFPVADHSGLGAEFEKEFAAANEFYLQRSLIDVVQNPNSFDFARGSDFYKYKALYEQGDNRAARTGDGRYLMRVYSEVDFSGGNGRFSIRFDCKETEKERFAFGNIKPHQMHRLRRSARCGGFAGFFIKMKSVDRVFFVPVEKLQKAYEKWEINRAIRRRTKAGEASLSVEDLETIGTEVFKNKAGLWDYLKIFDPPNAERA